MQGVNPKAWEVGVPRYVNRTYDKHEAPEHGWRYAVEDTRKRESGDPVVAWCHNSRDARLVADALNGRKP